MRRRWLRLTLLGVVVFALALLFRIPAGWALYLAEKRVPVDLGWQGASGTAWDAQVERLVVTLPTGREAVVGPLRLHTHLLAAVTGSVPVDFRVQSRFGEASGSLRLAPGGWQVPEVRGRLALAELPRLVPQLEVAGLEGQVLFRGQDLAGSFSGGPPRSGTLRASLDGLRVGLIRTERPLGDYALEMQAQGGEGFRGKVRTVNEKALLGVQGEADTDLAEGLVRFRGQGWAADDAPQAVHDILPLLGQARDGRVRIRWQGRIR